MGQLTRILRYCMLMVSSPAPPHVHPAKKSLALVTGQLSKEIQEVGLEIGTLFGVVDEDILRLQ